MEVKLKKGVELATFLDVHLPREDNQAAKESSVMTFVNDMNKTHHGQKSIVFKRVWFQRLETMASWPPPSATTQFLLIAIG